MERERKREREREREQRDYSVKLFFADKSRDLVEITFISKSGENKKSKSK